VHGGRRAGGDGHIAELAHSGHPQGVFLRLRYRLLVIELPQAVPGHTPEIDRTVTARLRHEPVSHAIVTKVIELAHMLDLAVVAEGGETAARTPLFQ
jgi:hypothetical protein